MFAAASTVFEGTFSKLERDDVDAPGKFTNAVEVIVARCRFEVRGVSGRCIRFGRKRVDTIAHLARLDSEHTSKLAAAEDADS